MGRLSAVRAARRTAAALRCLPALLRQTVSRAWQHRILGLSAEAAFWQLLSLPSLFLALLATLGYFSRWLGSTNVNATERQIETTLSKAFSPEVVDQIVKPLLHEILNGGRADILSVGFLLALWAGSSATATFVNTITIAYGMRDLRGALRSRLLALRLFLGSVLVGVVVLPLLVIGPDVLRRWVPARLKGTLGTVIDAGYYPVVVLVLMLGLTTLYHLAPPRRLRWRRGVPGAVLAMGVFLLGSATLRAYISFVVAHNNSYGTLVAPIATLLFFFLLALGVLLGAEFNAAIEERWPSPPRRPRLLHRGWRNLTEALPGGDDAPTEPAAQDRERRGVPLHALVRRLSPRRPAHRPSAGAP
jgi:membrane protein